MKPSAKKEKSLPSLLQNSARVIRSISVKKATHTFDNKVYNESFEQSPNTKMKIQLKNFVKTKSTLHPFTRVSLSTSKTQYKPSNNKLKIQPRSVLKDYETDIKIYNPIDKYFSFLVI